MSVAEMTDRPTGAIDALLGLKAFLVAKWDYFIIPVGISVLAFLMRGPIPSATVWGDDALLYRASRMPSGYASEFFLGTTQTGSDKYRGLLTPILALLTDRYGTDVQGYLQLTTALIAILAIVVYFIILITSSSRIISFFGAILVLLSRFNWYSQDNIYGIMEVGALILVVASVALCLKAHRSDTAIYSYISLAVVVLCAGTFVHERYVILSLIIPVCYLIEFVIAPTNWSRSAALASTQFFVIPIVHVLFKAGLLNVSPFTGGGESSFEQVRGWWIGRHFIESLTSITGLSTGVDEVSQYWGLNSVLFAVVAITIVVVVISLNLVMQLKGYFSKSRSSEQNIARRDLLLLFFLFSGTTLSASLVIERIEFRWLYGPFIFFILITAQLTRQFRLPSSGYFAVIPILSLLLLIDASYVPNHDDSRSQSNQVATALRALKSQAPPDGPWKLIVNTTNWQPWSQWQYGYGYVFSTLPNPPQEPVLIVNNLGKRALVDVCNQGWRPDQCVILGADGLKDQPTVSVLTVDRE